MELNSILILLILATIFLFTIVIVKRKKTLREQKRLEEKRLEEERLRLEREKQARIEQERKRLEEERLRLEREKQTKIEQEKQRLRLERLKLEREEQTKIEQERKLIEKENHRLLLERLKNKSKLQTPAISTPSVQAVLKADWLDFQKILTQNSITSLYHFTDRANIASIKQCGGLYSWEYCIKNGIVIPIAGGGSTSRVLDMKYGLQDYVRLSFTKKHPMMYVAQRDGRMIDPIILEIDIQAVYLQETIFSDMNATKTGHSHGSTIDAFKLIKFHVVKQTNHFNLSDNDKPYYQAEVMVRRFLPIKFIRNINQY